MHSQLPYFAEKIIGITITPEHMAQFIRYKEELLYWNSKFNLTAIKDEEGIMFKHFLDSLTCYYLLPDLRGKKVIDIGSGAGFPGIPLRVMQEFPLTLVDATRKKTEFLQHICDILQIADVTVVHGRAEKLGQDHSMREKFQVVTARAVARLDVLLELSLPLLEIDGYFLAQKGAELGKEMIAAEHALKKLGGVLEARSSLALPGGIGKRELLLFRKLDQTPAKYPRRVGVPEKKPLGEQL